MNWLWCCLFSTPHPLLSHRHQTTGAVIARCGQPEVSWWGWRNADDEHLVQSIAKACAVDGTSRKHLSNGSYTNGSDLPDTDFGESSHSVSLAAPSQLTHWHTHTLSAEHTPTTTTHRQMFPRWGSAFYVNSRPVRACLKQQVHTNTHISTSQCHTTWTVDNFAVFCVCVRILHNQQLWGGDIGHPAPKVTNPGCQVLRCCCS